MDDFEQVFSAVEDLGFRLQDRRLEPDPQRRDWHEVDQELSAVARLARSQTVASVAGALHLVEDPDERRDLAHHAGYVIGEASALLHVAGRRDARALIAEAARIAAEDPELDAAARGDFDSFATLVHGRWLHRQERYDDARRVFRALIGRTGTAVFKEAAQQGLDAPRPMKSLPTLFQINGFGMAMYGARDHREDGTHIKTYCVSALWIPILPVSAYRVHDYGDGTYTFYSKQRLSGFARGCQALLGLAVIGTIAAILISDHYGSDRYRAKKALTAARKLDRSGKTKAATRAYERLLHRYPRAAQETVDGAARRLVELYAAGVRRPVTRRSVKEVELVLQRFAKLPKRAREGPAAGSLVRRIEKWVVKVGTKTARDRAAAVELLALATRVARGGDLDRVSRRRRDVRIAGADAVATEWPIRALAVYVDYPTHAGALQRAAKVLARMAPQPFLLLTEERLVNRWLGHSGGRPNMAATRKAVMASLASARKRARDPARTALLAKPGEKKLAAYAAAHPDDQPVLAALARIQRQRGELQAAAKTIARLGPVSLMTPRGRLTAASIYADLGRLSKAAKILEGFLGGRLTRFKQAQRRYHRAAAKLQEQLLARVRAGDFPGPVASQLRATPRQEEQRKIVSKWMSDEFAGNARLSVLKAEYQRFPNVVPASLTLGMVKLRMARAEAGKRRSQLLADAEKLFLGIRREAAGVASYHLSLGQVYYRLGKTAQGEKEVADLLRNKDPEQHLGVVRAYRELGMIGRARKIATATWRSAPTKAARSNAASMMSLMADLLSEKEKWLKRADQTDPDIKINLASVRASRLYRAGKLKEADALYAQVEKFYLKNATHNATSANNAAISSQDRYQCTGDPRHLKRAKQNLEAAARLIPDNRLVISNLASATLYLGTIQVLSKWVRVAALRLGSREAARLLGTLLGGPVRDAVVRAMQANPHFRRSLDLTRQEEVLAPEATGGYDRELQLHSMFRDAVKLADLHQRIGQVRQLRTGPAAKFRREFYAGKHDKQILERLQRDVARWRSVIQRRASGHRPTLAAAYLLLAASHSERATMRVSLADARKAAEAYRKARLTWSDLGDSTSLASALALSALLAVAAQDPRLQGECRTHLRKLGLATMLQRLLRSSQARSLLVPVVARAEYKEALAVRQATLATRPHVLDWLLARAAGDADRVAKAKAAFNRPEDRLTSFIQSALAPDVLSYKLRASLFRAR